MKRIIYFITLLTLFLCTGCSEKIDFTLKGKIDNLPSDTLLLYYQVPQYKLDTLFCQHGEFEYSFTPDTFTVFSIIVNEQENLPIFAEKGKTVKITGSLNHLEIQGEGENHLFKQIQTALQGLDEEKAQTKVDSIIQAHPQSFTTLYLIDKYYTRKDTVDYNQLKKLLDKLHGNIKDTPYMGQLLSKVETIESKQKIRNVISIQGKQKDGEKIQWSKIKDKYILLNFWASWHPQSMVQTDSLKALLKELPKDFIIYNISLDVDKEAWLKAADEESEQWKHVCDFRGWNNLNVNNQGIQTLPFSLLLDKTKRVIVRNPSKQEILKQIKPKKK